jgi:hypothetical protein
LETRKEIMEWNVHVSSVLLTLYAYDWTTIPNRKSLAGPQINPEMGRLNSKHARGVGVDPAG